MKMANNKCLKCNWTLRITNEEKAGPKGEKKVIEYCTKCGYSNTKYV